MSKKEQPNYYAIIPATVRYDTNLKSAEKLLYGEITALCNKEGYCFASNEYFANLYGVSKRSVTGWIAALAAKHYIFVSPTRYIMIRNNKRGTKKNP